MTSALLDAVRHAFQGFSQAVAPVVVTALWQGAILASRGGRFACGSHQGFPQRIDLRIWAAGFAVSGVGLPVLSLY